MSTIKMQLTFTEASLADGHGFIDTDLPDGQRFSSRCWVGFADNVTDSMIRKAAKSPDGCCKGITAHGFLYDNGGGRPSKIICNDKYLSSHDIGSLLLNQNAEAFLAIALKNRQNTVSIYPKSVLEAFRAKVLAHMKTLDPDYLEDIRSQCGAIDYEDPHSGKPLTPEQICDTYLESSLMTLDEALDEQASEVIGQINGEAIYFVKHTGVYVYAGHHKAMHVLDIWINGANISQ